MATIWELSLKYQKGNLSFPPQELLRGVTAAGAELLPITSQHIITTLDIITAHKDPFDRMLLAQAKSEAAVLLTTDAELLKLKLHFVADARE